MLQVDGRSNRGRHRAERAIKLARCEVKYQGYCKYDHVLMA